MTMRDQKINQEFNEFLSCERLEPPTSIQEAVLSRVHRELNPSNYRVFLKMLGVHSIVSLFSLSICSQFGFQSLKLYDAMDSMMSLVGHTYCMAFCGLLYLSISAAALSLLLKPEEIKIIRRHKILQFTLLSGVSLGVFLCLGAQVLLVPGIFWAMGSLLGGIASLELGWAIRSQFRRRLIFGI